MTDTKFFILVAYICLAPHMSKQVSNLMGMLFLVLAIVCMVNK